MSNNGGLGPYLRVPKVLPKVKAEPPAQTVVDWMQAWDHHDFPLTVAYLAPQERASWGGYSWDFFSTSFTHIQCVIDQDTSSATYAEVGCSYVLHGSEEDPDGPSGWSVALTRQPGGRWLIRDYGQG
jgi:hypothetical protein